MGIRSITHRNLVDLQVGSRLRSIRLARGFSQEQLAAAADVTIQTVQKWESGIVRVPVSDMQKLTVILDVPSAFFFTDMPDTKPVEMRDGAEDVVGSGASLDALRLLRAFEAIKKPASRQAVVKLAETMAETETGRPQARDDT